MAFFPGFPGTTLVLMLGSSLALCVAVGTLSRAGYLATAVGLVGAVSVVGAPAAGEVAGGLATEGSAMDRLGHGCFLAGLFGLVALLLVRFTSGSSAVVLAAEVVLLVVFSSAGQSSSPDGPAR